MISNFYLTFNIEGSILRFLHYNFLEMKINIEYIPLRISKNTQSNILIF